MSGLITSSRTLTNQGLTDEQLRATPVPVSGTVTASGPLTDTQLRASVVKVSTTSTAPTAANILDSAATTHTASTSGTLMITVPAGRVWKGTVGLNCACVNTAGSGTTAGRALGFFSLTGTGVTPAAGAVFAVDARCAINAATGTTGTQGNQAQSRPMTIIAGSSDATLTLTSTITGSGGVVQAWVTGELL